MGGYIVRGIDLDRDLAGQQVLHEAEFLSMQLVSLRFFSAQSFRYLIQCACNLLLLVA
jgi:hypothetical protein